jgi:hypothetical protein
VGQAGGGPLDGRVRRQLTRLSVGSDQSYQLHRLLRLVMVFVRGT